MRVELFTCWERWCVLRNERAAIFERLWSKKKNQNYKNNSLKLLFFNSAPHASTCSAVLFFPETESFNCIFFLPRPRQIRTIIHFMYFDIFRADDQKALGTGVGHSDFWMNTNFFGKLAFRVHNERLIRFPLPVKWNMKSCGISSTRKVSKVCLNINRELRCPYVIPAPVFFPLGEYKIAANIVLVINFKFFIH